MAQWPLFRAHSFAAAVLAVVVALLLAAAGHLYFMTVRRATTGRFAQELVIDPSGLAWIDDRGVGGHAAWEEIEYLDARRRWEIHTRSGVSLVLPLTMNMVHATDHECRRRGIPWVRFGPMRFGAIVARVLLYAVVPSAVALIGLAAIPASPPGAGPPAWVAGLAMGVFGLGGVTLSILSRRSKRRGAAEKLR